MSSDVPIKTPPSDRTDAGSGGINVRFRLPLPPWMKRHARLLGFLLLALAITIGSTFLKDNPRKGAIPRLFVVTNWFAGGEHYVTFRLEPKNAEILSVGFYKEEPGVKPFQIRTLDTPSISYVHSNLSLRFVALPPIGILGTNGPMAYEPGTYIVAYTPSKPAHALQVEAVYRKQGLRLLVNQLRNAVSERLNPSQIEDSVEAAWWIYVGPFTNALFPPAMATTTNLGPPGRHRP